MIEANELRIGNIVSVNNEKHHPKLKNIPLQVTGILSTTGLDDEPTYSITLNDISQQPDSYNETYSQFLRFIQPIQLTPEILQSAGFVNANTFYDKGKLSITRLQPIMTVYWNSWKILEEIKYVHQLQNLYFALTEKELQIKLQTITQCHTPKTTNS